MMRGKDEVRGSLFSYVDLEQRVRPNHPLRTIRARVNEAGRDVSGVRRAVPLTGRDSIRSERPLVERVDFDLLFRPHLAQNTSGRRSAIDGRTTRHAG